MRKREDAKCELNISSFLTLPHLLDYFIGTRDVMSIVLLLQMMEEWDGMGAGGGGVG